MLENLSNKLQKILRDLRGHGRVSERHIDETTREIRNALLDADVHFKIAKDFVQRVKERALGQEVMESLTPGQQVVKVVRDELIELLGGDAGRAPVLQAAAHGLPAGRPAGIRQDHHGGKTGAVAVARTTTRRF